MVTTENILLDNLQAVFNTLESGILIESTDRTILSANQKFIEILGIPGKAEDFVGKDCVATAKMATAFFKHPEQFMLDVVEIPEAGKERLDVVESADGRHFKRRYLPVSKKGIITCHVWHFEQITSLMHKEVELINQRNFYHTILNELPADVAIFSADHKYLYLNKTAVRDDELRTWMIGKDDYEYCAYREQDIAIADERRDYFNRAKETGASVAWVDESMKADSTKDFMLRIFYPYFGDNKKLKFVIGYGINITEQKEQQIAISEEKERFKTLMQTLNDGVFQITFDGDIMLYNNAFLKALSLDDYNMPVKYQSDIMRHVHPDDKSELYYAFDQLRIRKYAQKGIFRVIDEDGETVRYVDYYIWHRHTDRDGNLVAGRVSDVTERVQKEQQMVTLIEREKELNNMKSNFIHITSHELRTPLSVIMSSAEILEMYESMGSDAVTIDKKKFTSGIVKEVKRITGILNELLIVGRIENNKVKYDPKQVDVHHYIDEIANEEFMPYTDGRNLNIRIDDDVKTIFIDSSLMRHAVVNVLSNAFKYSTGSAAPELHIFRKEQNIQIQITDHGIGIPDTELNNLFHSFYRASNVGNISGTGIGLMVVQHAIKTHNGSIAIESSIGRGSVFTIVIPDVQTTNNDN